MIYKYIILLATLSMNSGCTFFNVFKGPDDYYRHYHAKDIKDLFDRRIKNESERDAPFGFSDGGYSEENWNKYWNKRIFNIYEHEKDPRLKAYEGPSGVEFIRYIIEERRRRGLPEIIIEERNKDRIPKDLIKE